MQKIIKPCTNNFSAVVPVAGLSSRFGSFKPLFQIDGKPLIYRTVKSLLDGNVDKVVVVTGLNTEMIHEALREFKHRIIFVKNDSFESTDMLTSVKIGVSALPDCCAFFMLPGDMPCVSSETVRLLTQKFLDKKVDVIFPFYNNKAKHPPLISILLKDALLSYNGDNGLRGFFDSIKNDYTLGNIEVNDMGVTIDIDTVMDSEKVKIMDK